MKYIILFLLIFSMRLEANTIELASGEYIPFSGENIPNQGLTTMLVRAVFKEMHQDIHLEFMPWKRVMNRTNEGLIAGSFPWNLNPERLKKNYFSYPIHQYRVLAFTKKKRVFKDEASLKNKSICIPYGWDFSPYKELIKKLNMQVMSPITAESCFNMLSLGRVDVVFMNDLVGQDIVRRLFSKNSPVIGVQLPFFHKNSNLHFIISRKYPNGKKLMADFNRGLQKIIENGVYDSIVSTRSTCDFCSQLGSL